MVMGFIWRFYWGFCVFFSGLIWVCNGLHGTIEDVVMLWEYNQPEGIWEYNLAGIDILLNTMSKDDPWLMFGSVDGLHSKNNLPHLQYVFKFCRNRICFPTHEQDVDSRFLRIPLQVS